MSHNRHKKLESLAMQYATNRAEHRRVQKEINSIIAATDGDVMAAMNHAHDSWFGDVDDYGTYAGWLGWKEAVDVDIYNIKRLYPEQVDAALSLAELYDRRRALVPELGNIRRAIATVGRALLSKEQA